MMKLFKQFVVGLVMSIGLLAGFSRAGQRTETVAGVDITYSVTQDSAVQGDILTYDVVIENNGVTAVNFFFLNDFPSTAQLDVPFSSIDAPHPVGIDCTNFPASCEATLFNNPATFAPGDQWTLSFTGEVIAARFDEIINNIDLTVYDALGNTLGNFSDDIIVYPRVDVTFTKTLVPPAPQKIGDVVTFELAVNASGAYDAQDLVVADILPAELNYVGMTPVAPAVMPAGWNATTLSGTLTVPQNTTYVYTLTTVVNSSVTMGDSFTNTGSVTTGVHYTGLNLLDGPDTSSAGEDIEEVDVAGIPDLYTTIQHTTPPAVYDTDSVVTYDITVGNSGTDTATGAYYVFDFGVSPVPLTGWTVPTLFGQAGVVDYVAETITWSNLDIATGVANEVTITLQGALLNDEMAGAIFTADGTINMPLGQEDRETIMITDIPTNNIDTDADNDGTVLGRPDLQIAKTMLSPLDVQAGDTIMYQLTIDNTLGTAIATGIQISDTYDAAYFAPAGFTSTSTCPGSVTLASAITAHPVVFNVPDMDVNCVTTITLTGTLTNDVPPGYDLYNTGSLTTVTPQLHEPVDVGPDQDDHSFQINGYVDITVAKTLQEVLYPNGSTGTVLYGSGDQATYLVTVTNDGNSTYSFTVDDVFDSARFIDETYPSTALSVGAYSQTNFTVTATLQGDQTLSYQNTVVVDGEPGDFDSVVATGVYNGTTEGRAHLEVEKETTLATGYYGNDPIVFEFTISNNGFRDATGVQFVDNFPNGIFQSIDFSSCTAEGGTLGVPTLGDITCDNLSVPVGNPSLVLTMTGYLANGVAVDVYTNTGIISENPDHPGTEIDVPEDTSFFEVAPRRELSVTKTLTGVVYGDDDAGPCANVDQSTCPIYGSGDELTFEIIVTNTGNTGVSNLQVTDVFAPAVLTNVQGGANFDPVTQTWTVPYLAGNGGQVSLILTTTLNADTAGSLANTATLVQPADRNPVHDLWVQQSDTVTLQREGRAYLTVEKAVRYNAIDEGPYYPGDSVTFAVTVTNTGYRFATGTLADVFDTSVLAMVCDSVAAVAGTDGSVTNVTTAANTCDREFMIDTGSISNPSVLEMLVVGHIDPAVAKGLGVDQFHTNDVTLDDDGHHGVDTLVTTASDDFLLRPRTELSVVKEYCGMNADCTNPQDPYGNWYDGWQDVGFRVTLVNTGNTGADAITINDALNGYISGLDMSNGGSFSSAQNGQWSGLSLAMDTPVSLWMTGEITSENPSHCFDNTASYDTSDFDCADGSDADGICETTVNVSYNTGSCVLGMARIEIEKDTLLPGQCRVDARGVAYPGATVTINGQTCLAGPALPGDTIGFEIDLINSGLRPGSGLTVDDILAGVSSFPNTSETNMFDILNNEVLVCDSNDMNCVSLTVAEADLFSTTSDPSFLPIEVLAQDELHLFFTGVLRFATGFDINQVKTNTGTVSDPSLQSGVVIIGGSTTDPSTSDTSNVVISEYMMAQITKVDRDPAATNGVLYGDTLGYDITFANIGNTGFYGQITDTWPDDMQNVTIGDLVINAANVGPFRGATWPRFAQYEPTDEDTTDVSANGLVQWFSPSRYLPVNFEGTINLEGIVGNVVDGQVDNEVCLNYGSDSVNNIPEVCANATTSGRAQIVFEKTYDPNGSTQAGDTVFFDLIVTNTGYTDWAGDIILRDWLPNCMEVAGASSFSYVPTNNWAANPNDFVWEFNNSTPLGQAQIAAQNSLLVRIEATIGDPYECDYNMINAQFENQSCMIAGTTYPADWTFDITDDFCDNAIGQLAEEEFSIEKFISPSEVRLPGDVVTYELHITNNSSSDAQLTTLTDDWPEHILTLSGNGSIAYDNYNGDVITWNGATIGTITGNATEVITLTGVVRDAASITPYFGADFYNTGIVTFNAGNSSDDTVATGTLLSGIYSDKTPDIQYGVSGSQVTFTLSFTNYTSQNIDYLRITDHFPSLPDTLRYVSASVTPTNQDSVLGGTDIDPRWDEIVLPTPVVPGQTITVDVTAEVVTDANGFIQIENLAQSEVCNSPSAVDCYLDLRTGALVLPLADLEIDKVMTEPYPQSTSDFVEYDLFVTNIGATTATGIVIEDNWPQNIFVEGSETFCVSINGGTCNTSASYQPNVLGQSYVRGTGSPTTHTWLQNVPAGTEIRIHIQTQLSNDAGLNVGDTFCNPAEVSASSMEYTGPGAGVNQDTECGPIMGIPDAWTDKYFNGPNWPYLSGDLVQYQVLYGNSGDRVISGRDAANGLTGRTLTDSYPTFLDFVSYSQTSAPNVTLVSSGNNTLLFTGQDLQPGTTGGITLVFALNDNYDSYELTPANCFVNNVQVNLDPNYASLEPTTYQANNQTGSDEVCVLGRPDLAITKTILEGSTGSAAGTPVVYELTYENTSTGTAIASGWYIEDVLPSELTGYTFTPTESMSGGLTYTWSGSDLFVNGLAPGQGGTITIAGVIDTTLQAGTVFCNTGTIVSDVTQGDIDPTNNIGGNACVTAGGGRYVYKTPDVQYAVSGGLVGFDLTFENNTANNVCLVVVDNFNDLPNNHHQLLFWEGSANLLTYPLDGEAGGIISNILPVGAFGSEVVSFTGSVYPNGYAFTEIINTAEFYVMESANCASLDWTLILDQEPNYIATGVIYPLPDLEVQKIALEPNPQEVGDQVNYQVTVTNIGGVEATEIDLFDIFEDVPLNLTGSEFVLYRVRTNGSTQVLNNTYVGGPMYHRENLSLLPGEQLILEVFTELVDITGMSVGDTLCNTGRVGAKLDRYTGLHYDDVYTGYMGIGQDSDMACAILEGIPDLAIIDKVYNGELLYVSGDTVSYTINYTNSGNWPISGRYMQADGTMFSGWTVTDTYPAELSFSGVVATTGYPVTLLSDTNNTLVFAGSGTMAANNAQPGSLTLEFVLNANYDQDTCFTNTGLLTMPANYIDREHVYSNNMTGSEEVCVLGRPDLWIEKEILTGQYPDMSGDVVSYMISYGNSGTALATGREITDVLPSELVGYTFSPNAGDGVTHTWTGEGLGWLTGLAAGQTGYIYITGYLADDYPAGTVFCNTGEVTRAQGADRYTGNNIVAPDAACAVVGGAVDLGIIKTLSGGVSATGDRMSFNLHYYNTGTLTATGPVTVIDYLPGVFAVVTGSTIIEDMQGNAVPFSGPSIQVLPNHTMVTWDLNTDIVMGASGNISFSVELIEMLTGGSVVINTGFIEVYDPEPDYQNNRSTVPVTMGYLPDVWIHKTVALNATGRIGDPIVFELLFGNNGIPGSGDATGIFLGDLLPMSGFTFADTDCMVELAVTPGYYDPFGLWVAPVYGPSAATCAYDAPANVMRVNGLSLTGGYQGHVLITGYLDFQPYEPFCYTNTGMIANGYYSGLTNRVDVDVNMSNNQSVVQACIDPAFGVSVVKNAYPEWIRPIDPAVGLNISGSIVEFEIVVINNGEIPVSGTDLRDLLVPDYLTWLSSSTALLPPVNMLPTDITLAPGQSTGFRLTGRLDQRGRSSFTNYAGLTYAVGDSGATVTGSVLVQEPVQCGDYILAGMEQCEVLSGGTILSDIPLFSGQVCRECRIETDYIINEVVMCSDGVCLTGTVQVDVEQPEGFLSITKEPCPDGEYQQGDEIRYTIVVQNTGMGTINNVQFTDVRPWDKVEFIRYSSTPDLDLSVVNGQDIVGVIPELTPAGTAHDQYTITLYGRVMSDAVTIARNVACVASAEHDQICDEAEMDLGCETCEELDVEIRKIATTTDTLYLGDTARFIVDVTNYTDRDATNILMADFWPHHQLEFGGWTVDDPTVDGSLADGWLIPHLDANGGNVQFAFTGEVIVDEVVVPENIARIYFRADGEVPVLDLGNLHPAANTSSQDEEGEEPLDLSNEIEALMHGAADDIIIKEDSDVVHIGVTVPGTCEDLSPGYIRRDIDEVVELTCEASADSDETSQIVIDCDNGEEISGVGTSLIGECSYDQEGTYNPVCRVNGETTPACESTVLVEGPGPIGICGDGVVDRLEACDIGGDSRTSPGEPMDEDTGLGEDTDGNKISLPSDLRNRDNLRCERCTPEYDDNIPAVVPPACRYTDVPISIQVGEYLPYRWDIDFSENAMTDSCDGSRDAGKVVESSMKCTFSLYNRDREYLDDPIMTTTFDCDEDLRDNEYELFEYFRDNYLYEDTVQYSYGKYFIELDENQLDDAYGEYGEYKLSLDRVSYDYCDADGDRIDGITVDRVCQSNFALTKPYLMQKGVSSMRSDADLEDFYVLPHEEQDEDGVAEMVELDNVKTVSLSYYDGGDDLRSLMDDFIGKYDNLALEVGDTAGWLDGVDVSKVPGEHIYILEGNDITYEENTVFNEPITIVVKDAGLFTIKGDVTHSTMFIIDGEVAFDKPCEDGRQVVNGIIISRDGFVETERLQPNTELGEPWCADGGLTIEGVLVGTDIDNLIESKRSNLNDWFHKSQPGSSVEDWNEERRDEIYNGAAVLIEHNPSLRSNLPPGADDLYSTLEIYKE